MKSGCKKFTLKELAEVTQAKVEGDENHEIFHVNSLKEASSHEASFLANPRYLEELKRTQAGVICIDLHTPRISGKNYLLTEDPSRTFQKIAELFCCQNSSISGFTGIHPTAIIHPSAKLGKNVSVGPYAVIDEEVTIQGGTHIGSHVYVGPRVEIGSHCLFFPSVIIREDCQIGNRVILQPGAVIGSCGFGYLPDKSGAYHKIQQLGIVILEDDVEVGANTTIDRARFKETRIRKGSKIDNLVQIAHNVDIGENNIIAAQSGLAGSPQTEEQVILGGQVGITGHVKLQKGTMVAAQSGVSKSHPPYSKLRGTPAVALEDFSEQMIALRRLVKSEKKSKK